MRNLILLIAVVLELFFTGYCLVSKSNRVPAGYLCAIVAFLLFVLTIWLLLFPNYTLPKPTGLYSVATVQEQYVDRGRTETYTDNGENRSLQVKFWYPADGEEGSTFPLIVFSHGSYGVKESNVALFSELASHGYIVCSVDHSYQCFSTTDKDGKKIGMDMGYLKETMAQNSSDKVKSYEYFQKWMDIRTADINFILDVILEKAVQTGNSSVYQSIDADNIGLIGHSLGGSTVLGVGRMRTDIKAVISLEAPFMCDIVGVENDAFLWSEEPYPLPVLNIYTDSSWKNLGKWPQYAANYKLLDSVQPGVHSLYLKGAGHMTLCDLAYSCPLLCVVMGQNIFLDVDSTVRTLNGACLEYFDSYIKESGEFTQHH